MTREKAIKLLRKAAHLLKTSAFMECGDAESCEGYVDQALALLKPAENCLECVFHGKCSGPKWTQQPCSNFRKQLDPNCKPAPMRQAVKKAIELKPCPFCSEEQKQVTEVVEVLLTIVKYQEDALFLSNFILGDWQDLPLEVKQLIKKLKLKVWNKRAVLEKPAPSGQAEAGERKVVLGPASTLLLCKCGWNGEVDDQDALGSECGCCPQCGNENLIFATEAAAIIDRLEVELKQQYDKGFLEGTEAQEEVNRKHIIEPLEAEKKRLKDAMSEIGGISNLGQSPDTKSFEDMIVRLNKIWQIVWDLSKP